MSLAQTSKEELVKTHQIHDKDTGSADVQIALLTKRINEINEHLATAKKDHHSRLSLVKLVSQRRRHLNYLRSTATERYVELIQALGLRK